MLYLRYLEKQLCQQSIRMPVRQKFQNGKKTEVSTCFKHLFEKLDDNSPSVLTIIIQKVLVKKYSNIETAFVIAVCVSLLNPKYSKLKLTAKSAKKKVKYYLVCFINFFILKIINDGIFY
jgi:hypothetical protein